MSLLQHGQKYANSYYFSGCNEIIKVRRNLGILS